MIKSLPTRLFEHKRPVASQQYYRFINGRKPENAEDFDARLHLYPNHMGELVEKNDALARKTVKWWEIIMSPNEFYLYVRYVEIG